MLIYLLTQFVVLYCFLQKVQKALLQSDVQSKSDKSPVTVADYGTSSNLYVHHSYLSYYLLFLVKILIESVEEVLLWDPLEFHIAYCQKF